MDGNPAMPFYFIFAAGDNGYHLMGEGTGNKEATAAAFKELEALTAQDISLLIDLTRNAQKKPENPK